MTSRCPRVFQLPGTAAMGSSAIAYQLVVLVLGWDLLLICSASFNFGHPYITTFFIFATAITPPNETRSGQPQITNSSSDARSLCQMSPGMDVIPWHPAMLSETRDVRFCRQLGTYGEISPHHSNLSLWRDDGNTNPLCQLRLWHSITTRFLR